MLKVFTVIFIMLVPPGPPEAVAVDKVNKNGARLSWKKPKSDGGTPITGYLVEKQDESGDWVKCLESKEPTAFVPMKEGETAKFRVSGINAEGVGEPSKASAPITATNPPEAPRIATPADGVAGGPGSGVGGLQDITIKVNRATSIC